MAPCLMKSDEINSVESTASVYPKKLTCQWGKWVYSIVDSSRLTGKVAVGCTENDTAVSIGLEMQAEKVLAIDRQNSPALCVSERKHFFVWNRPIVLCRLLYCQNVVSKSSQLLHDRTRKVFVGVEKCHRLCSLVLEYFVGNFVGMGAVIGQRIGEVIRTDSRICL